MNKKYLIDYFKFNFIKFIKKNYIKFQIKSLNFKLFLIKRKMFYQLSSIKKPKRSFNLLHLETSEIYFVSLRASLVVDLKYDEIKGKIHLCSRSLLFEPKDVDQPLIKIKYSNNIIIKLFKNLDSNKLNVLLKT